MILTRSFLFAAACALPLSIAACSSNDKKTADVDAGQVAPEGTHYQYVVDQALVPVNPNQELSYGLDLGSSTSSKPDGSVDNQLAPVFTLLSGYNFPIQPTITQAVDRGSILLLADLQTTDLATAAAAGLSVKIGENPQPAACSSATDTTCRHHLDGSGRFSVAASSPANTIVTRTIAGGTFTGGPGNLTLQIALGSTNPITLNLVNARVKASQISATEMTAIIGGAVLETEFNTSVIPALAALIAPILQRDCADLTSPPTCGCASGTTGALLISILDTTHDCAISPAELGPSSIVGNALQPDVCSTASCSAADALSIGIKVHAVKATF